MHVIETGFEVAAVVLLAVLGWAVFVYFSPYRECRWCRWPPPRPPLLALQGHRS